MNFILDLLYSFLPKRRWRGQSPSSIAAMFSGIIESLLCAWLLLYRYAHFFSFHARQLIQLSHGSIAHANQGTQLYFGFVLTIQYLFFEPLSLLLAYLAAEGFVRALAALVAEEIIPSLLFKLVDSLDRIQGGNSKGKQEHSLIP